MQNILRTENLTRRFGKTVGIDGLNLTVEEGEIFGFLGPNGAGKTTTIRIVMNFLRADAGCVELFGERIKWGDYEYRRAIGFLPGELALPSVFTGEELLDYWRDLSGGKADMRDICLNALGMDKPALKRRTHEYSTGMKKKLGITGALQHNPKLVILDEPTNGLDPLVKHAFLELLKEMREKGSTIFFSSHNLPEVEQIADRTAIIRRGKLVVEAPIADLKHRHHKNITVSFKDKNELERFVKEAAFSYSMEGLTVKFMAAGELEPVLRALCGKQISDLNITNPALEDIFLKYYDNEN